MCQSVSNYRQTVLFFEFRVSKSASICVTVRRSMSFGEFRDRPRCCGPNLGLASQTRAPLLPQSN
jgi:hypothetical protein